MTEFTESVREEIAAGDPEVRYDYAELLLDSMIALQIKTIRQQQELTQEQLAGRADMKQSRISAMEQVDYSSWSIKTLKRLARAFDLRLRVTFESFGTLLDDFTKLGRADLERTSFAKDPAFAQGIPRSRTVDRQSKIEVSNVVYLNKYRAGRIRATTASEASPTREAQSNG